MSLNSTRNKFVLQLPAGNVAISAGDGPAVALKTVTFGIRPEDLTVCDATEGWFSGELAVVERLGSQTFGYLDAGTEKLITIEFPRSAEVRVGERLSVKGDIANTHLFETEKGQRIN